LQKYQLFYISLKLLLSFFVVTRVVFVVKLGLSWAGVVYLSLLK